MNKNTNRKLYESLVRVASNEFSNIRTLSDVTELKMIGEMLTCSKYKVIENQLKMATTSGIINFIDNNEYQPLVEVLLKKVFPPEDLDFFDDNTGSLSIDCAQLGTEPPVAQRNLTRILQGSTVKMSMADFNALSALAQKHSLGDIEFIPKGPPTPGSLADRMARYEALMVKMKKVQSLIDTLSLILRKDDRIRAQIAKNEVAIAEMTEAQKVAGAQSAEVSKQKEILKKWNVEHKPLTSGKLSDGKGGFTIGERDIAKKDLAHLISIHYEDKGALELLGRTVTTGTKVERNPDGFMDFDPVKDIKSASKDLLKKKKIVPTGVDLEQYQATAVNNFMKTLYKFHIENPELIARRKQIIDLLGGYDEEDEKAINPVLGFHNLAKNPQIQTQFQALITSFVESTDKKGSVMMLENIEDSQLLVPNQQGGRTFAKPSILYPFIQRCQSAPIKSMQSYEAEAGSSQSPKIMIIHSHIPIVGLREIGARIIEMNLTPVDEEEAEIIVRCLVEPWNGRAKRAAILKMKKDITSNADLSPQDQAIRKQESTNFVMNQGSFLCLDSGSEKQIKQMIVGMGQKAAIELVVSVLREAITVTRDKDDKSVIGINIDGDKARNKLYEHYNNEIAVPLRELGVDHRFAIIDIDDYMYKQGTDWAEQIGQIREMATIMRARRCQIDDARKQFSTLSTMVKNGKSENRDAISAQLTELRSKIDEWSEDYEQQLYTIPHMFILYGDPGTGKTVFAEVLAQITNGTDTILDKSGENIITEGTSGSYFSINLHRAQNKWVGETEKNTNKLVEQIAISRNCVWLMDELDRQVGMGTGAESSAGSPVAKQQVQQILDLFQTHNETFRKHNVYIIIATNDIHGIDAAMLNRVAGYGGKYEVEAITDPKQYVMYFKEKLVPIIKKIITKEKSRPPVHMKGGKEESWKEVDRLVATINMDEVAAVFAQKTFPFRLLENCFRKSLEQHYVFVTSEMRQGMPFTSDNLKSVARHANPGMGEGGRPDNEKLNNGIMGAVKEFREKANHGEVGYVQGLLLDAPTQEYLDQEQAKALSNIPLEGEPEIPSAKTPGKKQNNLLMLEEEPEQLIEQQMEGTEEVEGMEMDSIENAEESEDDSKKESSTDYYFRHLKKAGVVAEDDKVINKSKKKYQNVQSDSPGIYDFGQVWVAPASNGVPLQQLGVK